MRGQQLYFQPQGGNSSSKRYHADRQSTEKNLPNVRSGKTKDVGTGRRTGRLTFIKFGRKPTPSAINIPFSLSFSPKTAGMRPLELVSGRRGSVNHEKNADLQQHI
jgi:hypothetical protein